MEIIVRGVCSGTDVYEDKETGKQIGQVFLATGRTTLTVRTDDHELFKVGDMLVCRGNLAATPKGTFLTSGDVCILEDIDNAYFAENWKWLFELAKVKAKGESVG